MEAERHANATDARRAAPPPAIAADGRLCDPRFRALIGPEAWSRLPAAIRDRFSRRLGPGRAITYAGRIVESDRRPLGWLLAQACRAIGAPLPLGDDLDVAAVVSVTEDATTGGQTWTRMYARTDGFPQVIHSRKRFAGPTGLEEYLGAGFGIALRTRADPDAIHFVSDHYYLACAGWRLRLPPWLAPGALTVSHIQQADGRFAFVLSLRHPLAGEILRQTGLFRERPDPLEDPCHV